jgi:hypothetical protein
LARWPAERGVTKNMLRNVMDELLLVRARQR